MENVYVGLVKRQGGDALTIVGADTGDGAVFTEVFRAPFGNPWAEKRVVRRRIRAAALTRWIQHKLGRGWVLAHQQRW